MRVNFAHLIVCFLLVSDTAASATDSKILPVEPIRQETFVWCWAAVSEMVFRHYGAHNTHPDGRYQCGIVRSMAEMSMVEGLENTCAYNCLIPQCIAAAGSPEYLTKVLQEYPKRAAKELDRSQPRLTVLYEPRALSAAQIREEINAEHPIIAGINPTGHTGKPGESEHVALIVGYERDGDILVINDPGPYDVPKFGFAQTPYELAGGARLYSTGQYRIARDRFIKALQWSESLLVRRDGTLMAGELPRFCCTEVGRLGPYPNIGIGGVALEAGQTCMARYSGRGLLLGTACR